MMNMNDDERIDKDKNDETSWDFRELDDVDTQKEELLSGGHEDGKPDTNKTNNDKSDEYEEVCFICRRARPVRCLNCPIISVSAMTVCTRQWIRSASLIIRVC